MKKNYEKPTATVTSFQLDKDLTIDGSISVEPAPWSMGEADPVENAYQLG